MRRWALFLGGAVALVALLAGGLALAAMAYVGTPQFKARLADLLTDQAAREVRLEGPLGVSVWPVLGVTATQVSVANVEGGASPHLLTADAVDLGVDAPAALSGRIVVRRLRLTEPRITLETDATGQGNWMLGDPDRAPDPGGDLQIDLIEVEGGEIAFLDRATGFEQKASAIDLTTRVDGLDAPVKIGASLAYAGEPLTLSAEIASPRAISEGQRSGLSFRLTGKPLDAQFVGEVTPGAGVVAGRVEASGESLRHLAAWSGASLPQGEGLGRFNVSGALGVAPGRWTFDDAVIEVDDVRAKGDLTLALTGPRPALGGALTVGRLDLNRYLAPEPPGEAAERAPALDLARADWDDSTIDLAILRAVDADLDVTVSPLLLFASTVDHARLSASLNGGVLAATVHEMRLYGGEGAGRLGVDARDGATALSADLSLDDVDVRKLLADAVRFDLLDGKGQLRLRVETRGASQKAMVSALGGELGLVLNQGGLKGIDIGGLAETLRSAVRNELLRADAHTPFTSFSMSATIKDGLLATDDLQLGLARMRVRAAGVIDLPRRRLDLRLAPTGRLLTTPFTIRGPFGGLAVASDLRGRARTEIEAAAARVETAVRGRLPVPPTPRQPQE